MTTRMERLHQILQLEDGGGLRVARGAVLTFMLQVAGAGLMYLLQLTFARWMGPTGFGSYTFTIGWATIASIFTGLGLATAVLRFIPAYASKNDWSRLRGILKVSTLGTLVSGVGLALTGTLVLLSLGTTGGGTGIDVLLGLWLTPVLALLTLQQEAARGFHQMALAYAPPFVLRPLFSVLGAAICVGLGATLDSEAALAVTLAAAVIAAALQAIALRRNVPASVRTARPLYETRRWLRTAVPLLLVSGFVIVLWQTDVVMVGALLGARAAGVYGAAAKTAMLVGLVLVAVNAVSAPIFSSLFASGRHDELQRMVSAMSHWIFWPSLALSLLIGFLAEPILSLFGSGFAAGESILVVLLIGQVVNAAAGSVGWLLLVTGHQDDAARAYGCVAALHIALLAIGITVDGATGAAIGTTVSFCLWNVWLHRLVVRRLDLHPSIFANLAKSNSAAGAVEEG